jgi:cyclophilin family peptidyl-prolyl cis-trans isomerase
MLYRALTFCVLAAAVAIPFATGSGETAEDSADVVAESEVCVLETSKGTMVVRFFGDRAPATVANFKALVREGFYDGALFYRVVAGHVIQAGEGGENDRPTVEGEFGAYPHVVGAVGLARDEDPDSGSTEFYICTAPRPHLDGRYAVFGLLVDGLDVLEAISEVEVEEIFVGDNKNIAFHRPVEPVVIRRARLEKWNLGPIPQPDTTIEEEAP